MSTDTQVIILNIVLIILLYCAGFIFSLILLSKFGKVLDLDHYDPPHDSSYDEDYDNNDSAYAHFSMVWPIFWTVQILSLGYKRIINISESITKGITKTTKENKTIIRVESKKPEEGSLDELIDDLETIGLKLDRGTELKRTETRSIDDSIEYTSYLAEKLQEMIDR